MTSPQNGLMDPSAMHPLRMGLEPLAFERWLEQRADDNKLLEERGRLIAVHPYDVIAALPEAHDAVAELAEVINRRGGAIAGGEATWNVLESMGKSIAEDICVLTAEGSVYRLTAGVLCFPNRWRLADKIGRTVTEIHKQVPGYAARMSGTVDRFLDRLRPLRAFIRDNWGLTGTPALYLPNQIPPVSVSADNGIYLRREEQGFLKLSCTGAVIFSIRTTITPWEHVPESARYSIIAAAKALSPDWLAYKALKAE